VPIPTLPLAKTVSRDVPVELETLKGLRFPEPWTLKEVAEEVAFTPATVPLAMRGSIEPAVPEAVEFIVIIFGELEVDIVILMPGEIVKVGP
jgi:hypothetical protein